MFFPFLYFQPRCWDDDVLILLIHSWSLNLINVFFCFSWKSANCFNVLNWIGARLATVKLIFSVSLTLPLNASEPKSSPVSNTSIAFTIPAQTTLVETVGAMYSVLSFAFLAYCCKKFNVIGPSIMCTKSENKWFSARWCIPPTNHARPSCAKAISSFHLKEKQLVEILFNLSINRSEGVSSILEEIQPCSVIVNASYYLYSRIIASSTQTILYHPVRIAYILYISNFTLLLCVDTMDIVYSPWMLRVRLIYVRFWIKIGLAASEFRIFTRSMEIRPLYREREV